MPDEMFWEIHSGLPREGPGDNTSTRHAFELMKDLPLHPHILDVACGPGMQTMELARLSDGEITALDFHLPFLQEVDRRVRESGIANRVKTVHASMMEMPVSEGHFNIIWCEGAMYIMGVREALGDWRRFLAPGGYIAFTEPCFLTDEPSEEVRQAWMNDYPAMGSIENTKKIIEETNYDNLGHFVIPDSAWWDEYYTPQEARLKVLRETYHDVPEKLKHIEETQAEIDMHRQYSRYYGYIFFVVQKRDR